MPRNAFYWTVTLGLLATFAGCSSTSNITGNQLFGRRYSPETRFKVARAQEQGGKLHEAREIYMKLYRDGHASAKVCHRLAIVSAKMNDKPSSERFFREALGKDQRNADLLSDYGYAKSMNGDLKGAEAMYRQALVVNPAHKRTLNNLGIALAHQKRDKESLNIFRRAVGEAQAHSNLAYVQAQRGDGHAAAQSYSRALSIDPKLKIASNAMVQLASMEKKFLNTRRGRALMARAKQQRAGKSKQTTTVAKAAKRPPVRIKPKSNKESLIASIEDKPLKSAKEAPMPVIKPASKLAAKPHPKPIRIVERIPALPERGTPRVVHQEPQNSPVKPAVANDAEKGDKSNDTRLADATSTPVEKPRTQPSPFPTNGSTMKPVPVAPPNMPPEPAVGRQSRFKPPTVVATPTIQPRGTTQPTPAEPPRQEETREIPEFVLDLNDEPPQKQTQAQPVIRRPQFVAPAVGMQSDAGSGVNHAGGLGRFEMTDNTRPSPQQSTGRVRLSKQPRRAGVIKLRGSNGGETGRYRLRPSN